MEALAEAIPESAWCPLPQSICGARLWRPLAGEPAYARTGSEICRRCMAYRKIRPERAPSCARTETAGCHLETVVGRTSRDTRFSGSSCRRKAPPRTIRRDDPATAGSRSLPRLNRSAARSLLAHEVETRVLEYRGISRQSRRGDMCSTRRARRALLAA